LSTGAMVIAQIRKSGHKISMLVANNKANFSKKARGRIIFTCEDGHLVGDAIDSTVETGEGQTFWMQSTGVNEDGIVVSTFHFEWTVRLKK
ncbi:MAG TPA: thioesterase, partial [Pricia sp.]|nr:thioesterase [Pricia sp.]